MNSNTDSFTCRYAAGEQETDARLKKRYHLSEGTDLPDGLREAPQQERRAALRITVIFGILALLCFGAGLSVILMVDSALTYPLGLTLGLAGIGGLVSMPVINQKIKERLRRQTEKKCRSRMS